MVTPILYTVLAVINLIAYGIGIAFLPEFVPTQISGGVVEGLGSGWALIALPSVTALLALGVWLVYAKGTKTRRTWIIEFCLSLAGILFAATGWVWFSYAASGADAGESVLFPYGAAIVFPLALLTVAYGAILLHAKRGAWYVIRGRRADRSEEAWNLSVHLARICFTMAGIFAAVASVLFSVLAPEFDYISVILFAVSFALAAAVSVFLPKFLQK